MAAQKQKNATLVGFFLFLGFVALGVMIAKFGNIAGAFNGDYEIKVTFADASGLVKDSDVTYGGANVGSVTSNPKLNADGLIDVYISIEGGVKIPNGSTFHINSVSLLGDKSIAISPPETEVKTFYKDGDEVKGAGGGGIDDITNQAKDIALNANEAINDFRTMAKKLNGSVEKFDSMVVELNTSLKTINSTVLTKDNTSSIKQTLANLQKSSAAIQQTTSELKPIFASAKETIKTVKEATETAQKTFAKASVQIENLEPALKELPQTLVNLRSVSAKANGMMDKVSGVTRGAKTFIAKLNNNSGVIKMLTSDKEFQSNVKSFAKNLKEKGILRYQDDETAKKESPKEDRFRRKHIR